MIRKSSMLAAAAAIALALPVAARCEDAPVEASGALASPGAAPSPGATRPGLGRPPRAHWYSLSDTTKFGMQLDAGLPDAGGALIVFRPWWWVRFNGGLAYDYIGSGFRGGVTLVPWHWAITPSLNFDFGHFASGDASRFADHPTSTERELLKHAAFDFQSAQLGLEFGSQRRFAFYLRGGIAHVTASARGDRLTAYARESLGDPAVTVTVGDAKLKAVTPAASFGLVFFLF